jgi:hypothetical protein
MKKGFPTNQTADFAAESQPMGGVVTASSYTPSGGSAITTGAPNFIIGPFTPELNRSIYLELVATSAASGTYKILRSRDGGTTKLQMTVDTDLWGSYSISTATGVIFNEEIDSPTSSAFTYYLSFSLTAGSITYNMFQ